MNRKRRKGWLKHIDFMILDLVCLQLAYLVSYLIRDPEKFFLGGMSLYWTLDVLILVLNICFSLLRQSYKNILKRSVFREIESVLAHNAVIWAIAMGFLYVTKQAYWYSRTVFLVSLVTSIIFMLAGRLLWKWLIRRKIWSGKNLPYILVIATEESSKEMLKTFRTRMYNGFNLLGLAVLDKNMKGESIGKTPVVCGRDDILDYVLSETVDEVMINLPPRSQSTKNLVNALLEMGVVVHIVLDILDETLPNRSIERIGGYTFLTTSISSAGMAGSVIKRVIDVCAGLIGCAVTGAVFVFLAPAIYAASPGPIFFAQERVGRNGRSFKLYKFRSMYPDAEERKKDLMEQNEMSGSMFKMENDPRVIGSRPDRPGCGIGNFMRLSSLDELPQFFNILKGEMSLVGTRPPTAKEFQEYELHHKVRLSMKPGLTGMWQVSGRSRITEFEEIVRLDAWYIEHWNLRLDLRIIFKTVQVVIKRKGAK